mgnify:CR=1 FL=1
MKKIIIGSDHRGVVLKDKLKKYLESRDYQITDIGAFSKQSCDYPDTAYTVAKAVSGKKFTKGILICYSGIGNCIVANKIPGVRAAVCYNVKLARFSREHNDTNVLVLAAGFVSQVQAKKILDTWLKTKFSAGRHLRRLNKIKKIEKR